MDPVKRKRKKKNFAKIFRVLSRAQELRFGRANAEHTSPWSVIHSICLYDNSSHVDGCVCVCRKFFRIRWQSSVVCLNDFGAAKFRYFSGTMHTRQAATRKKWEIVFFRNISPWLHNDNSFQIVYGRLKRRHASICSPTLLPPLTLYCLHVLGKPISFSFTIEFSASLRILSDAHTHAHICMSTYTHTHTRALTLVSRICRRRRWRRRRGDRDHDGNVYSNTTEPGKIDD